MNTSREGKAGLISLNGVSIEFPTRRAGVTVKAVQDVSFGLERGESLALVGESGCGKSTLGRAMVGLTPVTRGEVIFHGRDLVSLGRAEHAHARRMLQMVFQNPYGALDPRFRIETSVREPLDVGRIGTRSERRSRVAEALHMVGLGERQAKAFPRQLSGGQLQRVGIARAIVTSPEVLICDEVTSALDVSVKIQIVDLLVRLREELKIAYIFISHDLGVVPEIASRVAVMYLGRVVEIVDASKFYRQSVHPYSRALLEAVPVPDPDIERGRSRTLLTGEVPSPTNPPSGCAFRSRCPLATDICREETPALTARQEGHLVACHLR